MTNSSRPACLLHACPIHTPSICSKGSKTAHCPLPGSVSRACCNALCRSGSFGLYSFGNQPLRHTNGAVGPGVPKFFVLTPRHQATSFPPRQHDTDAGLAQARRGLGFTAPLDPSSYITEIEFDSIHLRLPGGSKSQSCHWSALCCSAVGNSTSSPKTPSIKLRASFRHGEKAVLQCLCRQPELAMVRIHIRRLFERGLEPVSLWHIGPCRAEHTKTGFAALVACGRILQTPSLGSRGWRCSRPAR
jgi:hypothetical protein